MQEAARTRRPEIAAALFQTRSTKLEARNKFEFKKLNVEPAGRLAVSSFGIAF
jgi:hypothetical protein